VERINSEFLKDTKLVSIIIPNKDRFELISKCISEVLKNTKHDYEVIIGDTGSSDEKVWNYYETLPSHIRVEKGLDYNFSKTNNFLAGKAKGTHVLFLNNDVFFNGDAVSAMMSHCTEGIGAVGLRLIKTEGSSRFSTRGKAWLIDHDGQVLFKDGKIVTPDHLNINRRPNLLPDFDIATDGVTAACMLTRKNLFLHAGGFDDIYEDVYQDCDYCLKIASMGFRCMTVRKVTAEHIGSATRGPEKERESVERDREKYYAKWRDGNG
jgi:GT2 family glycosyltransferase